MIIYDQEKKDNLESKILNNTSLAFNCQFQIAEERENVNLEKAKAALGAGKNFDAYYLSSILASIGSNKNDDTFLPEELWAARQTPIHKQFNYNHNEKDIIGCIYDSFLLDSAGELITEESQISKINDIGTYAVIWTKWEDPNLQDRMDKTIAAIEANELFVSMEVLFKNFDYLLVKGNEQKVVKRSEDTSFLTKYLRGFGGDGVYQDHKIHRILRNFTFSGKGLVENPANKRSIIDTNFNVVSKGSENIDNIKKGTNNMSEALEKQIAEANEKLAKANKKYEDLVASHAKEKEEIVNSEIEKLVASNKEVTNQCESLTALAEELKGEIESLKVKAKEDKKDYDANLAKANEKIVELESEKVKASRISKLLEVGQTSESAEKIVSTWASVDEDQFNSVVALYEKTKSEDVSDDGKEDEVDDSKASDDFEETVDKSTANLNDIADKDSSEEENFKALASEISDILALNKKDSE